jgi:hypothetical protein
LKASRMAHAQPLGSAGMPTGVRPSHLASQVALSLLCMKTELSSNEIGVFFDREAIYR